MKLAIISCLLISSMAMATEKAPTREQHMAATAACKAIKADMMGKELKDCVKQKLGLK